MVPLDICAVCEGTGWIGVQVLDRSRGDIRYDRRPCDDCGGGGGADHYPDASDGPVRYYTVSRVAGVVGFLWAADNDEAAGYAHKLFGPDAYPFPAYRLWRRRLSQDKAAGIRPLEMLRRWRGEPADPNAGGIPPDADEQVAAGLHVLEQLAAEPVRYSRFSEGPVRWLPVSFQGRVIGYLWASDTADAADFVARKETGVLGVQATDWWRSRLEEAYAAGFRPLEAIRVLKGGQEIPMAGRIAEDAEEREAGDSRRVGSDG